MKMYYKSQKADSRNLFRRSAVTIRNEHHRHNTTKQNLKHLLTKTKQRGSPQRMEVIPVLPIAGQKLKRYCEGYLILWQYFKYFIHLFYVVSRSH